MTLSDLESQFIVVSSVLCVSFNKSAHDGCNIADADPQNILEPPTDGGYLFSDPIFTYYRPIFTNFDLVRGITSMIQKEIKNVPVLQIHPMHKCNSKQY